MRGYTNTQTHTTVPSALSSAATRRQAAGSSRTSRAQRRPSVHTSSQARIPLSAPAAPSALSRDVARTHSSKPKRSFTLIPRFREALKTVPARIMQPRILFVLAVGVLCAIGLMMVFSASSIEALTSKQQGYNPFFYVIRQFGFLAAGLFAFFVVSHINYHHFLTRFLPVLAVSILLLLGIVFTSFAGRDAFGATRWISVAGFSLQPSEFAKPVIVLAAASILDKFFYQKQDPAQSVRMAVFYIALPLGMILLQPDKGTTLVVVCTLLVMAFYAGASGKVCLSALVIGALGFFGLSIKDDYSRQRLMGMLDPWQSPDKFGYQLIQGFYAFGNGGIFGVGIGMGKQKYGYLPMAYNDFIFSVIGEEMGLVGCLVVVVCFATILYAGIKIARNVQDEAGKLIVIGISSMFAIQALLNVTGVLALFPLSGKPIPFVSYGGSSIIASFILAGLVVGVSRTAKLPATAADRARRSFSLAHQNEKEQARGTSELTYGMSESLARTASILDFSSLRTEVLSHTRSRGSSVSRGGNTTSSSRARTANSKRARISLTTRTSRERNVRISKNAQGYERIDIGPSPQDRLWSHRSYNTKRK